MAHLSLSTKYIFRRCYTNNLKAIKMYFMQLFIYSAAYFAALQHILHIVPYL